MGGDTAPSAGARRQQAIRFPSDKARIWSVSNGTENIQKLINLLGNELCLLDYITRQLLKMMRFVSMWSCLQLKVVALVKGLFQCFATSRKPPKQLRGKNVDKNLKADMFAMTWYKLQIIFLFVLGSGFGFRARYNTPAYSDSLFQSCDGLCSWPPPENVPIPSASLSPGRKSHRSSAESPCRSGPPSRWKSSDDRFLHTHCKNDGCSYDTCLKLQLLRLAYVQVIALNVQLQTVFSALGFVWCWREGTVLVWSSVSI